MAEKRSERSWWKTVVVAVVLIEAAGAASGWLSNSGYSNRWFDALAKPPFIPPAAAFAIVWPILYAILGVSVSMIIAEPASPRQQAALTLFFIQLGLNFA